MLTQRNLKTISCCSESFSLAPVLVAINHKDQIEGLKLALKSVEEQSYFKKQFVQIVILNDCSSGDLEEELIDLANKSYITLLTANCGNAANARNTLLDWADEQKAVKWIARLDADDQLASTSSLSNIIELLIQSGKSIALSGNNLVKGNQLAVHENHPSIEWIRDPVTLINFVKRFCNGLEKNELPSCNLIMANKLGIRYPNIKSAEDHWLVASLLLTQSQSLIIDDKGLYCTYHLNGDTTKDNKVSNTWKTSRQKLSIFVEILFSVLQRDVTLLGFGMEGVVYREKYDVVKQYYPWGMTDEEADRLGGICTNKAMPIPTGRFSKNKHTWYFHSDYTEYEKIGRTIPKSKIIKFLITCYKQHIAPSNIKRDNLMLHPNGDLHYIDVGKDIKPLSASYFLDLSARLFAIGSLGMSDHDLARRQSNHRQEENLKTLAGFEDFYRELIMSIHPLDMKPRRLLPKRMEAIDTSLLIKACAQDANGLYDQICHIVSQLEYPRKFSEKLLSIDPYEGPFLRQYDTPQLKSVIEQATKLQKNGVIDRIIIAPLSEDSIKDIYQQWFDRRDVANTHTIKNAPLYSQLWSFNQVKTRFVLQCDCDVLIGRKNWRHDYQQEMQQALNQPDVQCVGFNIPKSTSECLGYFGEPGQFAPEVRLGMLDLNKYYDALPLKNPVINQKFELTWHRAMQQFERQSKFYRSVRGGCPKTFYVHPNNVDKRILESGVIRDIISQGVVPEEQTEQFDLIPTATWTYPKRYEDIIFLLKGQNTSPQKFQRCLQSLKLQDNQSFGMVVIDDASCITHSFRYDLLLKSFAFNATLIRHRRKKGRIPNFLQAIEMICCNPNSLIVILDQDDYLLDRTAVSKLGEAKNKGFDLVQMPMFRPNKPVKLYEPDYIKSRSKHGANVWAHLRAFTKSLFMQVPKHYFMRPNGDWFESVTDYATMLPLTELAKKPLFLDTGYAYCHQRDLYSEDKKNYQTDLINELLNKAPLFREAKAPEL